MFGFFKNPDADKDAALIKQALGPDVAVVVSASCCMQGTDTADSAVEAVARAALQAAGLAWPVLTLTVTQAQNTLGRVSGQLTEPQGKLARDVSELFLATGLSAFPVLIVNQRLVSYGGVPGKQLVTDALKASLQVGHESAA